MSKPPKTKPGATPKALKVTRNDLPPGHTPHHDDWLQDEEVVDNYSGTEPIPVAPNTPTNDDSV